MELGLKFCRMGLSGIEKFFYFHFSNEQNFIFLKLYLLVDFLLKAIH
jgi:hypothetical protein